MREPAGDAVRKEFWLREEKNKGNITNCKAE